MPDLVGDDVRLLFVGINPGLWTAATQTHFAHPGNRFYPALLQAGLIERGIDRSAGFSEDDRLVRQAIADFARAMRIGAEAAAKYFSMGAM